MRDELVLVSQQIGKLLEGIELTELESTDLYRTIYQTIRRHTLFESKENVHGNEKES